MARGDGTAYYLANMQSLLAAGTPPVLPGQVSILDAPDQQAGITSGIGNQGTANWNFPNGQAGTAGTQLGLPAQVRGGATSSAIANGVAPSQPIIGGTPA